MAFPTCPAGALTGVAGPAGGEVLVPPRWFGSRLGASLAMALLGAPFPGQRCSPSSTPSYWSELGAGRGHWHHGDAPRVASSHGGQHLGHVPLCPDSNLKSSWKRGKEK